MAQGGLFLRFGRFGRNINKVFPDRKLYLFDTFDGFDKRDVKTEVNENYSQGNQDFSNTGIDLYGSAIIMK